MVWAVVVAAGRGRRAGWDENKVFHPLAGTSLLTRTLRALDACGVYDGIVLVLAEGEAERYERIAESEYRCPLVRCLAVGGDTRSRSVYNGLRLVPDTVDIVSVHDAARPFVTREIALATVESAREWGSGVIAMEVVDTIKRVDGDGWALETPDRLRLRAVQTPQTFRRDQILRAYDEAFAAGESATDDAALYERHIGKVRLVTTNDAQSNGKLTTAADFAVAERAFGSSCLVGLGYDAHRLVEGRRLVLCGVQIPWQRGLDGHSDADVAVHALMDAMLGAAGMGDIGGMFPDSDAAYKGISSMRLLANVKEAIASRGLCVRNFDLTIVAQLPKLMPYRDEMRRNLAAALDLPPERANVKATTTERMGFEGVGEGISAQAVVLLEPAF